MWSFNALYLERCIHLVHVQASVAVQVAKLDKASFLAELRGMGGPKGGAPLPAGTGPATAAAPVVAPAQGQAQTSPAWDVLSEGFGLQGEHSTLCRGRVKQNNVLVALVALVMIAEQGFAATSCIWGDYYKGHQLAKNSSLYTHNSCAVCIG